MTSGRLQLTLVALAAGVCLIWAAGSALATTSPTFAWVVCQHGDTIPGVQVSQVRGESSAAACRTAMAFWRWWKASASHARSVGGCRGVGRPYLKRHMWRRWHLSVSAQYGFIMSHRSVSFAVGGQDWPISCT